MKRFFTGIALTLSLTLAAMSCSSELLVPQSQLPETASRFIDEHFAGLTVAYIERDYNEYEVVFTNGWKVEFNRRGEWHHVDCRHDSVPASALRLLPEPILQYVAAHFSNAVINEMETRTMGYEIGLVNGPDLEFSRSGAFRRVD